MKKFQIYHMECDGKHYIGKHHGDIFQDNYFGCGNYFKDDTWYCPYGKIKANRWIELISHHSAQDIFREVLEEAEDSKTATYLEDKHILEYLDLYHDDLLNAKTNIINQATGTDILENISGRQARINMSEAAKDFNAGKSQEEIEESVRKRKETMESKSPEEKAEISRKISVSLLNRTTEEKEESIRKQKETNANKSPEEKEEQIRKQKETMSNKSPEEKAEISRKISVSLLNRTPEEKAETSRKMSESMLNKSPEEKEESIRKQKETNANKSPEEKEQRNKNISEGTKAGMARMTAEEKAEMSRKQRETMNNKSTEEKEAYGRKLSGSIKNYHENMTDEQRAERAAKISAANKGKGNKSFVVIDVKTNERYDFASGSLARQFLQQENLHGYVDTGKLFHTQYLLYHLEFFDSLNQGERA